MSKHTPGPWAIGFAGHLYRGERGTAQPLVMELWPAKEGKMAEADRALIAAAPEMLAFLRRYAEEAEASGGWEGDDALFNAAMALLARAEGR